MTRLSTAVHFWLDMQKGDEAEIAELIDILKAIRTFASTIRDGIRLMCDWRAGRTEILFAPGKTEISR